MKLVNTSVKRPVGVIMIVLAIIALGIVSVRSLVIDLFPKIDLPVAVVATTYEDAAPEDVENLISRPLESSVSSVEGIDTVQSQSQAGSSLVMMMFKNGVDLDQALLDVREKVDQVQGVLPDRAGDPNVLRFSPEQLPIIWVSITGDDPATLTELANDQTVPFFERQGGVASVNVEGVKEREIQVELDQAAMKQYGVDARTIVQSLNAGNESGSVGTAEKGDQDLQLRVTGEFTDLADIEETIIQTESGAQIHVDDVATVEDTYEESSAETLVNGESSIVMSIMKKTDSNTVEVATNVKDSLAEAEKDLPEGVELKTVIDTSEFIQMSVNSVVKNILIGGAMAVLILLLFLKSIRATIVIGLSIPIAVISAFSLLYFTGQTLNILTLGGLALGIGMMVDSSIVILEHIYSYRQQGYRLFDSAVKGASELAPAVIASTTTTLVVFVPIIYVEGIASDLFTPLALAVSFSLIASLVVAITLVPMLSSKLLKKAIEDDGKGRRYWFNRLLERVKNGYSHVLKRVLKFRKTTIAGTLIAIAGSVALTPLIGTELIPSTDQGQVEISVETAPGSSFEFTEDLVEDINETLENYDGYIETNYVSFGGNGQMGLESGNDPSYTMQLIPSTERDKSTKEIVQEMGEDLEEVPGADIQVHAVDESMDIGDPISIALNGPEHEVLADLADDVATEIADIDGVYNPESGSGSGLPQLSVSVDDDRAAMYGLTQEQVQGQIDLRFTGQIATEYREEGHEMNVKLLFPEDERSDIADLENMQIQSPSGAEVPLEDIATLEFTEGPVALTRENQQPQLNVTSEVAGRDLGSVVDDVESTLEDMHLPENYSYSIGGQAEDMAESFSDLAIALVFSIFLVYAVMAVQFENFLFPFIIMFSLPATVIGVVLGLFLTDLPLSMPALIGVIMLAGIVVNNSIVLVDYINILRRKGSGRYEAIISAGRSRLRPILMTTLTTILAMVPLGIGLGEGAELQQPLAITIIFGLAISSIFTLLLIPVVYTLFDDFTQKVTRTGKQSDRDEASPATDE